MCQIHLLCFLSIDCYLNHIAGFHTHGEREPFSGSLSHASQPSLERLLPVKNVRNLLLPQGKSPFSMSLSHVMRWYPQNIRVRALFFLLAFTWFHFLGLSYLGDGRTFRRKDSVEGTYC